MEKENHSTTPADPAVDEQQVSALTEMLLKISQDLDHAVQNPLDTVAIAEVAEEIFFSLPGLQGVEEEKREEISTVILAIVDYVFTQGVNAAGTYLGVQNKLEFTEAVETYCEVQDRLISCDTIGMLVDAHIVKEKEAEEAQRQRIEKEEKIHNN